MVLADFDVLLLRLRVGYFFTPRIYVQSLIQYSDQAEIFSPLHDNVIANLADIYSNTVSQILPKIMVSGESNFLNNPANANKIRALLLAGVRSAVLWTQTGGGRWQVLFKRKQFVQAARELLDSQQSDFED